MALCSTTAYSAVRSIGSESVSYTHLDVYKRQAHVLMNRTFAATGGAGCIAQLDSLFELLHRNGTEEIIEAEDMDKYSNCLLYTSRCV